MGVSMGWAGSGLRLHSRQGGRWAGSWAQRAHVSQVALATASVPNRCWPDTHRLLVLLRSPIKLARLMHANASRFHPPF